MDKTSIQFWIGFFILDVKNFDKHHTVCYKCLYNIETRNDIARNIKEKIAKSGGTMLEDLPTSLKAIKKLEKENKNKFINNGKNR